MKSSTRFAVPAALSLAIGCGGADGDLARVERHENGAYQPVAVSAYAVSGARDGATTEATAMFALENRDTLRVYLKVTYNPAPVLAQGRWRLDRFGSTGEDGDVREESLKFLGGQGATPSLGGRFRLESGGSTRWRVVMPVRPLGRE